MAANDFLRPDVLVLAGGGIVGDAWMQGVLAGMEDAGADFSGVECFVGTSAGSIVATRMVAGERLQRPGDPVAAPPLGERDGAEARAGAGKAAAAAATRYAWAASAPLAPMALALGAPAGALARAALLARAPSGGRSLEALRRAVAKADLSFDGRLRVCCVDRANGRRVVFGAPGAPSASVADAVTASCSIPWVFRPVRIGEREYVDGGVWSVTNMDAAPVGRGARVLCLDVSRGMQATGAMGVLRQAFRAGAAFETQVLRRRGARVWHVGPDAAAAQAVGANLMDSGRASGALAAGYAQGGAAAD